MDAEFTNSLSRLVPEAAILAIVLWYMSKRDKEFTETLNRFADNDKELSGAISKLADNQEQHTHAIDSLSKAIDEIQSGRK